MSASRSYRLSVSLTEQQAEAVARLAKVEACSRAEVIRQIVEAFTPNMMRVAAFLEQANAAERDMRESIARVAVEQEKRLLPAIEQAQAAFESGLDEFEAMMRQPPSAVTRGLPPHDKDKQDSRLAE